MVADARQRVALLAGCLASAALGLFPPWTVSFEYISIRGGVPVLSEVPAGHSFLLRPPSADRVPPPRVPGTLPDPARGVRLDFKRLLTGWAVVLLATAAITLALGLLPARRGPHGPAGRGVIGATSQMVRQGMHSWRGWRPTDGQRMLLQGLAGVALSLAALASLALGQSRGVGAQALLTFGAFLPGVPALVFNLRFIRALKDADGAAVELAGGVLLVAIVCSSVAVTFALIYTLALAIS